MPQALKCPTCSAPLDYPADGATAIHCPYCNNTVLLSDAGQSNAPADHGGRTGAPLAGHAIEFADVMALIAAGNKIGAIRVYRQRTGAGLAVSKNAVEDMAAGRPVAAYVTAATTVASTGLAVGCAMTVGIITLVIVVISIALHSVRHAATPTIRPAWTPPAPMLAPPTPFLLKPAPSGFARVKLEFGSEGIGPGQFKDSRSIALDGQGHIYVGEYSDGRVQVFDADGKFLSAWSIGHGKSLLNLTAERKGTVYAVIPGHILRFEGTSGKALGEVGNVADDGPEFYMDGFVALNGEIWAVGTNSDIVVLDAAGKINRILKSREKVGEDVSFERVIALSTGEIYALDRQKGVFKFSAEGRYLNRFGGGGIEARGPGHLLAPRSIAADGKGRIYVVESNLTIQVFDGEGTYIDSFGGPDVAFGIAIDDQNAIYTSYRNRHTIRKFVVEK